MKRVLVAASVSCLALLMGCPIELGEQAKEGEQGGDGDGNRPGGSSGVDEDLPLNGLNSDDAQSLCDWANKTFAASEALFSGQNLCTIIALGSSPDAATCEQTASECVESGMFDMPPPPPPGADENQECVESIAEVTANCDVKVEELQGCLNDTFAQIEAFFSNLTCDVAGQPPPEPPAAPESCLALEAKCPGLGLDEPVEGPGGDGPGDEPGPGPGPGPGGEGFPCPEGNVVPFEAVCDGNPDCGGAEDEMFCEGGPGDGPGDGPGGPTCEDGTPISVEQFCDGNQDCAGGEDEAFCGEPGGDLPPPPPSDGLSAATIRAVRPLWLKH